MCAIPKVQFNVYFTDCLTQRLCHEESKWKCKALISRGGVHGPACSGVAQCECLSCHCCSGLPAWCCWSWTKCNSFAITRQLVATFLTLWFLWSSLVLQADCRRGREQRWPLPSALGRSSALCFVLDTCIRLELIGQGEVRSTVCVRLQLVQDPGPLTAAIIGVKPLWLPEVSGVLSPRDGKVLLASSTWAWCEMC